MTSFQAFAVFENRIIFLIKLKEALGIASLEFSFPLLLFSVTDLNERLDVFFSVSHICVTAIVPVFREKFAR